MHITSQYRPTSATCCTAVFACLRDKITSEVSGSAMLADLLEKLNGMQEACARPADFKDRFDEFVARARIILISSSHSFRSWSSSCRQMRSSSGLRLKLD